MVHTCYPASPVATGEVAGCCDGHVNQVFVGPCLLLRRS